MRTMATLAPKRLSIDVSEDMSGSSGVVAGLAGKSAKVAAQRMCAMLIQPNGRTEGIFTPPLNARAAPRLQTNEKRFLRIL